MTKQQKGKFQGFRLKEARELTGLTIQDLAEKLDITKQAISQFENGKSQPSVETLLKLERLLDFPYTYFYKEKTVNRTNPLFFRKYDSATKNNRFKAEIKQEWTKEIFDFLNQYIQFPETNLPDFDIIDFENLKDSEIDEFASMTRKFWKIGNGPISNMIGLLESNGIIVTRISIVTEIDAFSTYYGNRAMILLGDDKISAVRSRFDAAHELGHLVLHKSVTDEDQKDKELHDLIEIQANRFAGAFLLPEETFTNEFISLNLSILEKMKSRWLVSMQSMAMRAGELGLVTENQKINFFRNIKASGYKIIEPLDGTIPKEQPIILSKAIELLKNEILSPLEILNAINLRKNDICEILGVSKDFFHSENNIIDFALLSRKQI